MTTIKTLLLNGRIPGLRQWHTKSKSAALLSVLKSFNKTFTWNNSQGFTWHTGSIRKTRVAAVRFKPTPPAVSDNKNTLGELELRSEKFSMARALASWLILPSSLTKEKSSFLSAFSIISKNEVNWDTTRLLVDGSLSRMAHNAPISASSWNGRWQPHCYNKYIVDSHTWEM